MRGAHASRSDPFTLHIYAAPAEQERRMISQRTSAVLQAAKERHVVLGNAANVGTATRAAARARDAKLESMLRELAHLSSREIAAELARRGVKISYRTVQRAMERLQID